MTTRALQIECLLTPIYDYRDNSLAVGYTVYFYEAGTSTPKNVYTEKEKTNPYTTRTLGSDGTVQVYGEGVYKIIIKDSDGTTVYSWDDVKVEAVNFQVVTKTSTYTATPDDDVILVDTDGGNVTINLQALANFTHPLTIKNVGSNSVIIDANGSETIDGNTTVTFSAANYAATLYPGSSEWKLGQVASKVVDSDGDTYWDAEATADRDKLDAYIAGTKQITIEDGAIFGATDDDVDLGKSGNEFKNLYLDGVAYIDEYEITGAYKATMPTNGVGASAKFMLGDSNTIAWFYLNTAPPGWKVLATGADMVCGISGGSQAFNVNGGNTGGTWTVAGLTKDAHTHTGPSHNHKWYEAKTAANDNDGSYDTDGGSTAFSNSGTDKDAANYSLVMDQGGIGLGDYWTGNDGTGNTGDQSDSAISSDATWRPAAAVGKLFQLDTA